MMCQPASKQEEMRLLINARNKAIQECLTRIEEISTAVRQRRVALENGPLVRVPDDHAGSHLFIRDGPDSHGNMEYDVFHGYIRDIQTYVLVLLRKESTPSQFGRPGQDEMPGESIIMMFLHPARQFKVVDQVNKTPGRKRCLEKEDDGKIEALWDLYLGMWTAEASQREKSIEGSTTWLRVSARSYYTPDDNIRIPSIARGQMLRCSKERSKKMKAKSGKKAKTQE